MMAIYAPDCGAVLPNPASHAFHSAITAMDVTFNSVDFLPWPGRHVRRTSSTFAHGGLYYHGEYTDHAAYREIECGICYHLKLYSHHFGFHLEGTVLVVLSTYYRVEEIGHQQLLGTLSGNLGSIQVVVGLI